MGKDDEAAKAAARDEANRKMAETKRRNEEARARQLEQIKRDEANRKMAETKRRNEEARARQLEQIKRDEEARRRKGK